MKIRNGFVSNSSSTSFVVRADQKDMAETYGLVLANVGKIRNALKKYEAAKEEFLKTCKSLNVDFLTDYGCYINCSDEDFENLNDEDYITHPYDRDRAYEKRICDHFGAFQSDL